MSSKRMITSDTFSDESFIELDNFSRVLWIGLITACADDQGRLQHNPLLIKSIVFPADRVSVTKVISTIKVFENYELILCYEKDGKKLIQIKNWWKYQAPSWASPSRFPAPVSWIDREKYHTKGNKIVTSNWDREGGFTPISLDVPSELGSALPSTLPSELDSTLHSNEIKIKNKIKNKVKDDVKASNARKIFSLYEREIGPLTPIIGDALKDAIETYPVEWIEDSIQLSARNNVRKWSYAEAILSDWQTNGFRSKKQSRKVETISKNQPPRGVLDINLVDLVMQDDEVIDG